MQDDEPDSPLKVKLANLANMISKFGYIGAIVIAVLYFGYYIMSAGGLPRISPLVPLRSSRMW